MTDAAPHLGCSAGSSRVLNSPIRSEARNRTFLFVDALRLSAGDAESRIPAGPRAADPVLAGPSRGGGWNECLPAERHRRVHPADTPRAERHEVRRGRAELYELPRSPIVF